MIACKTLRTEIEHIVAEHVKAYTFDCFQVYLMRVRGNVAVSRPSTSVLQDAGWDSNSPAIKNP